MKLGEAINLASSFNGHVCFGDPPDWSEYSTQYFWSEGKLYWTKGMTHGGRQDYLESAHLALEGFHVYRNWRDAEMLDSNQQN